MTIEDHIRDEKLQYHQAKLISMNILLAKKDYVLINSK